MPKYLKILCLLSYISYQNYNFEAQIKAHGFKKL